jgi:hypothetical protein
VIQGNDGNDEIHPGDSGVVLSTVRGGKGDDIINPFATKAVPANGVLPQTGWDGTTTNKDEHWYGDEGDDIIYGGQMSTGVQILRGGSGDDKITKGYDQGGAAYLTGDGGKDVIRTDYFQDEDMLPAGVFDDPGADQHQYIWGDWAYGPEG